MEENKNDMSDITQLLLNMVDSQKQTIKSQTKVFIIVIVCYTVLLLSMVVGFFIYDSQFDYTETLTTEREITQEVSGENSTINNVDGNQYNDSATHNERMAGDE